MKVNVALPIKLIYPLEEVPHISFSLGFQTYLPCFLVDLCALKWATVWLWFEFVCFSFILFVWVNIVSASICLHPKYTGHLLCQCKVVPLVLPSDWVKGQNQIEESTIQGKDELLSTRLKVKCLPLCLPYKFIQPEMQISFILLIHLGR